MKKYNLIKVIAITIVVAWLLTLIIPGSSFGYTGGIQTTTIQSTGLWGLFSNLSISISYFNSIALFVIAIACFYAILGKTKTYEKFVNSTTSKFEKNERKLVIISTLFFAIVSLFVSNFTILLVFVPFIYSVMKKLNVDKKIILSSTIISSIIGSMCGIYNSSLFSLLNLDINTLLLVKVILFIISIFVLLIFIAPKKNNKKTLEVKKEEKTSKTSTLKKSEEKVVEEKKTTSTKKSPAKKKTVAKKTTTKSRKGA